MIPTRRMNIQATIDPHPVEVNKFVVSLWDDEGNSMVRNIPAKSEREAFNSALIIFREEFE